MRNWVSASSLEPARGRLSQRGNRRKTRFAEGDIRGIEARFAPESRTNNLKLVRLVKAWAERKSVTPSQLALAWLMVQKNWIVPIPGTTQMAHMLENNAAAQVTFNNQGLRNSMRPWLKSASKVNGYHRLCSPIAGRSPSAVMFSV